MTWAEFRRWAKTHLGVTLQPLPKAPAVTAIWGSSYRTSRGSGTGSGHHATYGIREQRRLALSIRAAPLVAISVLQDWLTVAELYDDGWLINDGAGIRWVSDPELEAADLVRRGFVAVKCGV